LANLPAAIQTGIEGFVTFPWASYTQQFIAAQLGFAQMFYTSLNSAVRGLVAGLPTFASGLDTAIHTFLAGDYFGAVGQVGTALSQLFITGFDVSNYTVAVNAVGFPPIIDVTATAFPVPLGPLPDFFNAIGVFAQDAQYLTNLMPPSIPRQISQNLTNVLKTATDPSVVALATLNINTTVFPPIAAGTLSGFFGLPIVLSYAALGPAITGLYGFATVAASVNQALGAGNFLGVLGTLIDSPAVITNALLNGQVIQDVPIPIALPPPLAPPLPTEVVINLHVPVDGLLVPPHYATATVSTNSQIAIPGVPFEATIFGTPFMGLVPLLVNYMPQQFAQAIRLPG
jgi:hypothetical protein